MINSLRRFARSVGRQIALRSPRGAPKPAWTTNPDNIAPSGKAYPRIHTHRSSYPQSRWEVQSLIDRFYEAANSLGIKDFDVWVPDNYPGNVAVRFGTVDLMDYGRVLFTVFGDMYGDYRHNQSFADADSDNDRRNWVTAARDLLERNDIPYFFRQISENKVQFGFDRFSLQTAFNIAIDRGLINELAAGKI